MESTTPPPPPAEPPPPVAEQPVADGPYPVRFEARRQDEYHRFLPLVKWLLALPHYVVLFFVGIGAFVAIVASWFAVLITGRYPRGLFDFVVGTYRWGMRVTAYVYLLTDDYPPFSLAEDPDYPVEVEVGYPEHVDRWRPLVAWLLALPYLLVAGVLAYLAGIVALIGVFVILFTRELPQGMFNLIVNPLRWQLRGNVYATWMATRYPPFSWED